MLRDGRFDIRVFTPGGFDAYEIDGVKVFRFPWKMLPSAAFPFLFRRRNEQLFLSRVKESGVKISDVAVVHVHTALFMPYALVVKSLNPKCKTLLHHHDQQSFGLNLGRLRHLWLYKFILFRQLRKMHDRIDCHVFISHKVEERFRAAPRCHKCCYDDYRRQMRGLGWMRSAIVKQSIVLYNGVDRELFRLRSASACEPNGTFEIGCVANFDVLKDQITLIMAIEKLRDERVLLQPDVRCPHVCFVGTGIMLDECKRYVESHSLSEYFTFEREVRHECLPAFYQSLDLFVLPSYFEGFGCVYIEAWASGVPFIACEGQAMDELLTDEDRRRWTIFPHDYDALADRIASLLRKDADLSLPKLTCDVDIRTLVPKFLSQVENLAVV